jgi:hypothetical protein
MGVALPQLTDYFPGLIGAAVIHKYYFVAEFVFVDYTFNPGRQFGQRLIFIK